MDPTQDTELSALLRKAQTGNSAAYDRFLREISAVLRAFLLKRMDAISAEDVLQETLISIHRSRHTFLPERPVSPWLYAICENRMLDFFRRQRRHDHKEAALRQETDISVYNAETGTETETETETDGSLLAAVTKLPGIQRKVIELLKIQELSVKEVSRELKMSESAVKVTAHRGYETIRKIFGVKREN